MNLDEQAIEAAAIAFVGEDEWAKLSPNLQGDWRIDVQRCIAAYRAALPRATRDDAADRALHKLVALRDLKDNDPAEYKRLSSQGVRDRAWDEARVALGPAVRAGIPMTRDREAAQKLAAEIPAPSSSPSLRDAAIRLLDATEEATVSDGLMPELIRARHALAAACALPASSEPDSEAERIRLNEDARGSYRLHLERHGHPRGEFDVWLLAYIAGRKSSEGVSATAEPTASIKDDELRERMEMIERFAHAIADPACEECEGSGMYEEDSEWSLCECSQTKLRKTEASFEGSASTSASPPQEDA